MQPKSTMMGRAAPSRENGPISIILVMRDRRFWLVLQLLVAGLVEVANKTPSLFHLNFRRRLRYPPAIPHEYGMHQPQERVDEQVERLFNEQETLGCERGFCVVPDGRIVILIRFSFGVEPNIVVIVLMGIEPGTRIFVVWIGFVPDVGRGVEIMRRASEGMSKRQRY